MSAVSVLYVIYAVVLLVGGAMGYVKAKSTPSLVAGVTSAALTLVAFLMIHQGHTRRGLILGVIVSTALIGFFGQRYAATKKAMPALLIVILSIIVLVLSLVKVL